MRFFQSEPSNSTDLTAHAAADSFNAMGIAEAVARKSGAMILACPMYGSHPAHHWGMPGTIPLTFETHVGLLTDIVRGAANAGFNKFLIISAHGQTMSMFEAVHKLGIRDTLPSAAPGMIS